MDWFDLESYKHALASWQGPLKASRYWTLREVSRSKDCLEFRIECTELHWKDLAMAVTVRRLGTEVYLEQQVMIHDERALTFSRRCSGENDPLLFRFPNRNRSKSDPDGSIEMRDITVDGLVMRALALWNYHQDDSPRFILVNYGGTLLFPVESVDVFQPVYWRGLY
jgi:hypothetical protein